MEFSFGLRSAESSLEATSTSRTLIFDIVLFDKVWPTSKSTRCVRLRSTLWAFFSCPARVVNKVSQLTTASELWVAPAADTSKAKQITSKGSAVGRFSWTANGGFVFAGADGNLFALNPDGSARTLLTPNDHGNQDPSACGGGRFIVYAAFREQKLGIWRMDADGSNPIRIADETVAQNPQCSPDGKWVVYLRGPTWIPVRVAITGTEQPVVLTQDLVTGFGYSLEISPYGSRIVYVATPDSPVGSPASPSTSRPNRLKVIPSSGGAPLYQFDWPASATNPRWSHGGDAIDYVLARNGVSNVWRQKLTRWQEEVKPAMLS